MQSHDIICRVAVYPRFIKESVFDIEQFLTPGPLDKQKSVYVLSVVSKWLLKTDMAVHDYGESVAKAGNDRLNLKYNCIVPDNLKQYYLAFYQLRICDVVCVNLKFYSIHVKWSPIIECNEHFHIEMRQLSHQCTKVEKRRDRTKAIYKIARKLNGPTSQNFNPNDARNSLLNKLPRLPNSGPK